MRRARSLAVAVMVCGWAQPAAAQAPRITPAGDPSVRNDTLYALAVPDSAARDEPYIYLLDDGVVRLEANGRVTRTYRQIIQVFTREGAENWGELSFSFRPQNERLTVNWVRVLARDGRVIADSASHQQESLAPVAEEAPVYTDTRIRRLSLGGVAPGTIVDYSVTTEVTTPLVPGDFTAGWSVRTGRLVRRSRYILDVPAGLTPVIQEHNWRLPRPTTTRDGRRTYVWAAADVPKVESEPFMGEDDTVFVSVNVALPRSWQDVSRWYAGLTRDRYALTPALDSQLAEVVRGAATLEDSLRAAHRWVAQDFRYVSLSLGLGGYQPRAPGAVLESRYGDCKDKATLFVALARRLGARAWPVLLSVEGSADSAMPSVRQFDHMIAALERPGGGYLFADLTADLVPWGELPPAEQGGFALLVRDDGRGEPIILPRTPATANRTLIRITGELSPDGRFSGHFERTGSGSRQYTLRNAFASPMAPDARERFIRSLAQGLFENAAGDSLLAFDGRDLRAEPRVGLRLRDGRALENAGGLDLLRLPIDNLANAGLVAELEARGPRRFPINVGAVVGRFEYQAEFVVTLPPGWRVRVPGGVEARSVFGDYRSAYAQEGRVVRVTRTLSGSDGSVAPDRIGELIAWLRAVSRDDVRLLALERR